MVWVWIGEFRPSKVAREAIRTLGNLLVSATRIRCSVACSGCLGLNSEDIYMSRTGRTPACACPHIRSMGFVRTAENIAHLEPPEN